MAKKRNAKKVYEEIRTISSKAFAAYRAEASKLGRLQSKHRSILGGLAASNVRSGNFEKAFDKELDRQEQEVIEQRKVVRQAYATYKEKKRIDGPQIAHPFNHAQYAASKYVVGSHMLARADQAGGGDEDLSNCGGATPKIFWKIGWHYLKSWDGISFTHIPFPLYESSGGMPLATNERQWLPTNYAIDGPVPDILRMGAQGANGSAHYEIAYGIDIGDSSPCGVEFHTSSEVAGVVDVGGSVTDTNTYPHVDLDLNIHVYQYRCLGAPIAEVDLNRVPVYRVWRAFPLLSWETWAGEEAQDEICLNTVGLYSTPPFQAQINRKIKDVRAGDSFLFVYRGGVFASQSGVQLSHNNVGTWVVREPVMLLHYYPPQPGIGNRVVVHI
ncbi:MAG: hypothetical protein A2Z44_10230 [Betaproteobacteria bacterium RBG_19FT_COMBO_58_11]|nr:MAG: hypothetical protein A2Z44_10230 [Betaproteobacteria bacterium RBG_19FT_COMBO_58_11]